VIRIYRPIGLHVKQPLLRHIVMKLEYSQKIVENFLIFNFMKINPMWAELFHADGRKDKTKLIAAFRKFFETA
jgi:hypothetical protein